MQRVPKLHWIPWLWSLLCLWLLLSLLPAQAQQQNMPEPPATYYGLVQAGPDFTPAPGMTMTAWISGTLCGEAQTQEASGEVIYSIDVEIDWAAAPGCGASGREIRFKVGIYPMQPLALWDNSQLHALDLSPALPTAVDDVYTTTEDTPLVVAAPGVLDNDDDAEGPPLTAVKDSDPLGALALHIDGALVYTATLNFNGVTSFTYHANNGIADSNIAAVTITVMAENDPPQFTSTPITTAVEDVAYTYVITATDVDTGDSLTIIATVKPAWLTFTDYDGGAATLSGTPGRADVGEHYVELHVYDLAGLSDTQAFTITVIAETIPPTVLAVSPTNDATDVARNAPIVVDFSEAMLTGGVSTLITPTVSSLVETWSNGDARLTLIHDDFAASTRYTVTVAGGDLTGNPMALPYTWIFTTGLEIAPEADLSLGKVREGIGAVTAGDTITYTFTVANSGPTEPVTALVVDTFSDVSALASVSGSGCIWSGTTTVTCPVASVISTTSVVTLVVTTSDTYSGTLSNSATVVLTGNVVDPNTSNNNAGPVSVSVQYSPGDITPPTIIAVSPANDAVDVARNAPITMDFSEAMAIGSVSALITPTVGGLIETWSNGNARLTLNHDDFIASTRYTITAAGSDLTGNPMASPYTWAFTTGAEIAPEADLSLGKVRDGSGVVTAGEHITYTFTITNAGPTGPVTATLVDVFSDASALTVIDGAGCIWPGAETVTCTVTGVATTTPSLLTLVVTTSATYSGTLHNSATVAPAEGVVDPDTGNNLARPVSVTVTTEEVGEEHHIYLPLVLRHS